MKRLLAIAITMWAGACAARAFDPPVIAIDRSACSRCGMLISEPTHAAAVRTPDGHDQLFDDIGCLVAAMQAGAPADVRYWFHDATDGEWIDGANPIFVASPALRTPMSGGIAAFRDRASADRFVARYGGQIVADVSGLILMRKDGSSR